MTKRPTKQLLIDDHAPRQSRRVRKRDPKQPELLFDPMPSRIEPCLALLKSKPPIGAEWSYEIKWDGYRLAVHIEPSGVRILTRGGHDWTHRFPAIAAAAAAMGPTTMILDGEAVVLDEQGRSDFGALQKSLGGRGGKLKSNEAIFYAFDLLYLNGHGLTHVEYGSRRHLLEDVVTEKVGPVRLSEEIDADPDVLLAQACSLGLEGIIAKHRDRPYRSGRLGDWLKIKCIQSDSFVVVGYEPSTSVPGAVGSLLLGARYKTGYRYVGSVGTGFKHKEAQELRATLDRLKTKSPEVKVPGKNVVLVSPTLIAEIEYRAWTDDGKLRHASYKGLRERQDNADIYKLTDEA
ncbi:bifunctional non-homologous end joining protein LigD [Pararhizobium capsulatum DSM 1112]|uniref:DNA ligase (ATP) n=1 Tax=Pararhizobium capsulatum DSM 1112 TaxID=1121113 RepID=A0ABU0BQT8_9HYPH|nr:non-homologous end-joining DNA ligase [Pararhizobium capsulatum]MDQ0320046.1 bifunctional non-homologous end joining protein LigD [Pararhizobium capsulatum DSM 1112]